MTLPPLRDPISYWTVQIEHLDGYNGWAVQSFSDEVFVSPGGYPAIKRYVAYRTREEAETFLRLNKVIIERRCATKSGFVAFKVVRAQSYWPVTFDIEIDLAKIGKRGSPLDQTRDRK